jgi:hypothetical protein
MFFGPSSFLMTSQVTFIASIPIRTRLDLYCKHLLDFDEITLPPVCTHTARTERLPLCGDAARGVGCRNSKCACDVAPRVVSVQLELNTRAIQLIHQMAEKFALAVLSRVPLCCACLSRSGGVSCFLPPKMNEFQNRARKCFGNTRSRR